HFRSVLDDIISHPRRGIHHVRLLTEPEKKRLVKDFNDTRVDLPETKTILEYFEEQVEISGDHIAVSGVSLFTATVSGQRAGINEPAQISYRELNENSHRLAARLRVAGVTPDSNPIVAIKSDRCVEMITGILGILKAGGAYLPIDPDYPKERINFMLKDSAAKIIVTNGLMVDRLDGLIAERLKNAGEPANKPINRQTNKPANLAYIIYTSGSTGRPKGVMVEHRNLMAYMNAFLKEFRITSRSIVIQQASFSFDTFAEEVYPVLIRGGKVVIPLKEEVIEIDRFAEIILTRGVNILDCSPLLLDRLNRPEVVESLKYVRLIISGGDVLKREYIGNLLNTGDVYNTYGPTETTVCSAYYKCKPFNRSNVPIGKPIANYNVHVLDTYGNLQ
ncbi:MAG: AMP-binding protein, partial [bacterium]|nr:AMP-binding protein [bacterium]